MFRFLQRNLALSENKGPEGIISRKKPRTCLVGKGAAETVMSRRNSFLPGKTEGSFCKLVSSTKLTGILCPHVRFLAQINWCLPHADAL